MKLSTIVGILTLLVVVAGIAAALWQSDAGRTSESSPALQRDLFGAPLLRGDDTPQPSAAPSEDLSADVDAPLPEEPHRDKPDDAPAIGIPELPAEPEPPAEPFEPPQITAYA